jgi:hypothetical protein
VLLGVLYRSAKIEALLDRSTHEAAYAPAHDILTGATYPGLPLSMDLSGVGGRMAIAFGL